MSPQKEEETDKSMNSEIETGFYGAISYTGLRNLHDVTVSYIRKAGWLKRVYPHCGSSAKGPYTRKASHLLFFHTMAQLLNTNPGYARQPCEHAWNGSHLGT